MQKLKNRTTAIMIAILLTVSMSASTMLIPNANAHTPAWGVPTFAHIFVTINPIGVGQSEHIYLFLTPTYADTAMPNDYRFHNYQLTITAPDGTIKTESWATVQDTTSNQGYAFTPDQVGTYNFNFTYPGQKVNDYSHSPTSAYINDTYLPSTASATLTVQEESIPYIGTPPLPTEYWTRPIYGENTDWWSISSNWLGNGAPGNGASLGPNQRQYPGDAVGSQTNHIMWTKEIQPGGVVGGNNFAVQGDTYFEGTAYQQRFTNPIIVYGRIYYKEPLSFAASGGPTVCVDLRSGQVIWNRTDVPALSFAYIYDLQQPNYHGVYPAILFTSNFARAFDADTGEPLFNVTGASSGTAVLGPQGEQIKYSFVNNASTGQPQDYYLCEWNSSLMWTGSSTVWGIVTTATTTYSLVNTTYWDNNVKVTHSENVSTTTTAIQGSRGIFYDTLDSATQNKSISWRNNQAGSPTIVAAFYNDILLCRNGSYPALGDNGQPYTYFGVNLNASKGPIGQVLWWSNVKQPAGNITTVSFAGADKSGYFCESYRQTSQFVFFNLRTGAYIGISDPQPALDYYGSTGPGTLSNVVAYGHVYSSAYSGILYCYDMATGKVLWTYGNGGAGNSTSSGFQVPGPYPTFVNAIGNGIIYTVTTEHTFETPIYKGAVVRAINATDGTEIWTLSAATGEFGAESYAIADGFSVFFNSYDQQIYSVGRGPSATSVTASPKVSTFGNNVVIEGLVTDVSAGTKQNEQAARFPNGIPAASDASMKDWMGYVYQQQPLPTDFTGVPVSVNVVDANGNYRNIGTATTDANGAYHLVWQPDISGTYTVMATFGGTNSYWPSHSETAFNIMETQSTPTPTASAKTSIADQYFLPMSIAIIIAIIVIGAILALLVLRKRP